MTTIIVNIVPPAAQKGLPYLPTVRPAHNPKTCRVYKCGLCAAVTVKEKNERISD